MKIFSAQQQQSFKPMQGPSGCWALSDCPMELTQLVSKACTQNLGFLPHLPTRKTTPSAVLPVTKGLDWMYFSQVKQGIISSH